jgi:GNAT superfamily N-acetyltransferase
MGHESAVMTEAAKYLSLERLRDGREIKICALKPADENDMLAAIDRTSARSLYRRFFGAKRNFSEGEKAYFLDVDFVNHVALIAVAQDAGRRLIVGGGRYIVVRPATAELALAVVDEYQGHGIGAALLRHLIALARDAGLRQLVAEVLPENGPMLRIFRKSAHKVETKREDGVVHITLPLSD